MSSFVPPSVISSVLNQMLGVFDRRALASVVIPAAFFVTAETAAMLFLFSNGGDLKIWWEGLGGAGQAFIVFVYILGVMIFSLVLLAMQPALERLFQGAWPRPAGLFASWLTTRQRENHLGLRELYESSNCVLKRLDEADRSLRDLSRIAPGDLVSIAPGDHSAGDQGKSGNWSEVQKECKKLENWIDKLQHTVHRRYGSYQPSAGGQPSEGQASAGEAGGDRTSEPEKIRDQGSQQSGASSPERQGFFRRFRRTLSEGFPSDGIIEQLNFQIGEISKSIEKLRNDVPVAMAGETRGRDDASVSDDQRVVSTSGNGEVNNSGRFRCYVDYFAARFADTRSRWSIITEEYREAYLFTYPTRDGSLAPTLLGNVFRAMDEYPYRLYGLDAVSAWPRMQPSIPPEFLEPLRDAKSTLNQLLTFATLIFACAFPLAFIVAVRAELPAWNPTPGGNIDYGFVATLFVISVIVLIFIAALPFDRRRKYRLSGRVRTSSDSRDGGNSEHLRKISWGIPRTKTRSCLERIFYGAILILISGTSLVLALALWKDLGEDGGTLLVQAAIWLSIVGGATVLSYLFYWNAVVVAAIYGEKVGAAFDLYRWKVLDQAGLARPQNLREEWKTWEGLRNLVFSDRLDARMVAYAPRAISPEGEIGTYLVPKEFIPRGAEIKACDLRVAGLSKSVLPEHPVTEVGQITEKVALRSLPRGQAISRNLACPRNIAANKTEVVVKMKAEPSIDGWLLLEGDRVLVGGRVKSSGSGSIVKIKGTVCQVNPYDDEARRMQSNGHRFVGEADVPVSVIIDIEELDELLQVDLSERMVLSRRTEQDGDLDGDVVEVEQTVANPGAPPPPTGCGGGGSSR
ncbi:hypothetical protein [Parafrankia sp. FMc2]|uniref:hypothetical protein n=1 Tax=Parafrankia sp. FMc2 TaxID=3233196 RepID=UPI0034D669EA